MSVWGLQKDEEKERDGRRFDQIDWGCPLEAVSLPLPHVSWLASTLGLFRNSRFLSAPDPKIKIQGFTNISTYYVLHRTYH